MAKVRDAVRTCQSGVHGLSLLESRWHTRGVTALVKSSERAWDGARARKRGGCVAYRLSEERRCDHLNSKRTTPRVDTSTPRRDWNSRLSERLTSPKVPRWNVATLHTPNWVSGSPCNNDCSYGSTRAYCAAEDRDFASARAQERMHDAT